MIHFSPFFFCFFKVLVYASRFPLFLFPFFLFKMWFSAYFLYFEMAHLLFFSVTVQLMVIMAERLDLAFMLKRKVKFKSLFFFFLCSWKIGNLRMVHLCFIAFLGVWTLNIYRGAWSWNYCYFCYFCLRIVDFERMDWFWIYCMRI
jgi:hypothetical protein